MDFATFCLAVLSCLIVIQLVIFAIFLEPGIEKSMSITLGIVALVYLIPVFGYIVNYVVIIWR